MHHAALVFLCAAVAAAVVAAATSPIVVADEVAAALAAGRAVVALESTIIAHGMPFPRNLETALAVEAAVRGAGAVPATIAVVGGVPHVGLRPSEMEAIAVRGSSASASVAKVSRRDLAAVVAAGGDGATTVSGTMLLAAMAGIRVFVTGGIGGVHRGFEETMDVSADLTELGRTPVCVVSAGVKSLLDIGRTLEALETQGVPVVGFNTSEFPAFFTRSSGFRAPLRLNTTRQCAQLVDAGMRMGMQNGVLVAVPIPEADAADGAIVEDAIRTALEEAKAARVSGRDVTPFMLRRVSEITHGASLDSNVALVKNNARIGAQIAVELAALQQQQQSGSDLEHKHRVVVFGAAIIDVLAKPEHKLLPRTTSSGSVTLQWGGVGRNIAEALTRLGGLDPLLVSVLSDDAFGKVSLDHMREIGMETGGLLTVPSSKTRVCDEGGVCHEESKTRTSALCNALMNEKGEQVAGICDTSIIAELTPERAALFEQQISGAEMVVLDGNLATETIRAILDLASKHHVRCAFEPTSVPKSTRIIDAGAQLSVLRLVTPNRDELEAMVAHLPEEHKLGRDVQTIQGQCGALIHAGVEAVLVKLGTDGVTLCELDNGETFTTHIAAPSPSSLVNVVGAGDSFVSGVLWGVLARGMSLRDSLALGRRAAQLSLESATPISPLLTAESLFVN